MKQKIKSFVTEHKVALMSSATAMMVAIPQTAFATEVTPPDVASSMATAMQQIVTTTLSAITAIAPIGITIFGAMFAWKKGVQFFKGVTK